MTDKTKILIVDDDISFAEGLADVLTEKGYETIAVNSGKDAVEKTGEISFDVILMDIKMPVMNGVETFKQIKKTSAKTVVIMMTAFSVEDSAKEALQNGAFGCLSKPVDIDKLVEQIELTKEKGILILVIDDDPGTRETFKDVLEAKGYIVSTAATGEEAINLVRERPHHILFIDMKLPNMNGLEVYLAIKEINPKAMAVAMSGYYEEMKTFISWALKKGIYTYLNKPLDMDKVLELIEEIIGKIKREW